MQNLSRSSYAFSTSAAWTEERARPCKHALHSFWCFSLERYGILEKIQKSWKAPELQLIHKFSNLQTLASVDLSQTIQAALCHCFTEMKKAKTALPDTAIDGVAVFKYKENMLCSPNYVCAVRLPF